MQLELKALKKRSSLDSKNIPQHIAIIPDGNRRWAKNTQMETSQGHRQGADIMLDITEAAKEFGVSYLTFYVFSTENWTRSKEEVDCLLLLLESYLYGQMERMMQNEVHFQTIGDLSKFPPSILKAIDTVKEKTTDNKGITLTLALNYGGRDDLKRAVQKMMHDRIEEITEESIQRYLDTFYAPDPELIIRTGKEMRISNFLLWQSSYAELHFSNVFWPEFSPSNLLEAILDFQKRDRRRGGE